MNNIVDKAEQDIATIFATITSPHMVTQLYMKSILQCIPFHISVDVMYNADMLAFGGAHN
eukprot:596312-Ditylum_brightwellii.AAC.1